MLDVRPTVAIKKLFLALALFAAADARALVLYDNGVPSLQFFPSSFVSDFDDTNTGMVQQWGDDFTLKPGRNTIADFHWWGEYGRNVITNTGEDDFAIRIFEINGGVSDTSPIVDLSLGNDYTRKATGLVSDFGWDVFEYWADVTPFDLSPNTPYLLSIVNNTEGVTTQSEWGWATSGLGLFDGNSRFRGGDGTAWSEGTYSETAFNITGIPEPVTATLLGLGIAGIGYRRRRQGS